MGAAIVVPSLNDLYLVRPDGSVTSLGDAGLDPLPSSVERTLREVPSGTAIRADTGERAEGLRVTLGREVGVASVEELRESRRALPRPSEGVERRQILQMARRRLESALASPEEVLISLAREEERLERAVGREARAAEAFLVPEGSSLGEYADAWNSVRTVLERHHASLVDRTRRHAVRLVPNLASVVGPGVAARLVASAGGVSALSRMRASRLQLLGSRRRPSPDRGPRYGLLFRAERMPDVPPDRRGAYARSLAALASIAIRADATTHADLAARLVERRDRRVEQLRKRGR